MKTAAKRFSNSLGFTLVEMLVTVGIIAVLLALLMPALSMVRNMAAMVKQKAQFAAIEIAIEAFAEPPGLGGFGGYPPSNNNDASFYNNPLYGLFPYTGAQKLAEAIVGRDGFGCHRNSVFATDGTDALSGGGAPLYDPPAPVQLADRLGPYLELEKANAVKLSNIYSSSALSSARLSGDTYVLTDMFGLVTHRGTGKRTGMPILYYRADTNKIEHDLAPPANWDDKYEDSTNIYDYKDNYLFYALEPPWDTSQLHPVRPVGGDPKRLFYDRTLNPNFPSPRRPYNSQSFILHSAGLDGLYGTPDDVFNFDEAN